MNNTTENIYSIEAMKKDYKSGIVGYFEGQTTDQKIQAMRDFNECNFKDKFVNYVKNPSMLFWIAKTLQAEGFKLLRVERSKRL